MEKRESFYIEILTIVKKKFDKSFFILLVFTHVEQALITKEYLFYKRKLVDYRSKLKNNRINEQKKCSNFLCYIPFSQDYHNISSTVSYISATLADTTLLLLLGILALVKLLCICMDETKATANSKTRKESSVQYLQVLYLRAWDQNHVYLGYKRSNFSLSDVVVVRVVKHTTKLGSSQNHRLRSYSAISWFGLALDWIEKSELLEETIFAWQNDC